MSVMNPFGFVLVTLALFFGMQAYAGKEKAVIPEKIERDCSFCNKKFTYAEDDDSSKKLARIFRYHLKATHGINEVAPRHPGEIIPCPLEGCNNTRYDFSSFATHLNSHKQDSRALFEGHTRNCTVCTINSVSANGFTLYSNRESSLSHQKIKEGQVPNWIHHPIECPQGDHSVNSLAEFFVHLVKKHPSQKKQMIEDHIRDCIPCTENKVESDWFLIEGENNKRKSARSSDLAFSEEQQGELEPEHSVPKPGFRPVEVQTNARTLPQASRDEFQMNVFDEDFENVSEAFPEQHPYLPLTAEEKAELKKQGEEALSKKHP